MLDRRAASKLTSCAPYLPQGHQMARVAAAETAILKTVEFEFVESGPQSLARMKSWSAATKVSRWMTSQCCLWVATRSRETAPSRAPCRSLRLRLVRGGGLRQYELQSQVDCWYVDTPPMTPTTTSKHARQKGTVSRCRKVMVRLPDIGISGMGGRLVLTSPHSLRLANELGRRFSWRKSNPRLLLAQLSAARAALVDPVFCAARRRRYPPCPC